MTTPREREVATKRERFVRADLSVTSCGIGAFACLQWGFWPGVLYSTVFCVVTSLIAAIYCEVVQP